MTDVPEREPRVRVFEEIAAATKQLGQILRDLARLRAEPIAGLDRLALGRHVRARSREECPELGLQPLE